MKCLVSFLLTVVSALNNVSAGEVTGLSTDLITRTSTVWSGGYLSSVSLQDAVLEPGVFQFAEIRSRRPMLGWRLENFPDNTIQTAYRVLVASSPELLEEGSADIWDSGRTAGDNSCAVRLDAELKPSSLYWWKVRVWDNHGGESAYSKAACFATASTLDGVQARLPLVKDDEAPVLLDTLEDGIVFVDFGRDAYGQLRFVCCSESDSDTLMVRLGEACDKGRIRCDVGKSSIRCTSYRIPLQKGTHSYRINFRKDRRNSTIVPGRDFNPVLMPGYIGEVYPFRYCEFDGSGIKGVVRETVHYPFDDDASCFRSSDDVLNAVWDLCKYSIKATTALGVYIDGDRERVPYEADALINQLGHYCTDSEYSLGRYSVDFLCRNATWPSEWILQAVLMCWNDYLYTGNCALLEKNYDILKARTLEDLKGPYGLISTRTGLQTPALMSRIGYAGKAIRDIVDWPQSGSAGVGKEEKGEADGFVFSDYNTVVNAYHYRCLVLMSGIADALGKREDAARYRKNAASFHKAFNSLLFDAEAGCYRDGVGVEHHSLHSNMFALDFGLVPQGRKASVLRHIRSRGMACSVYGAQFLLEALYGEGDGDYALGLLTDKGLRGWYNMIRVGSTITLEAWDEVFKPNLDWNHAWGAAPANVIPSGLMGVRPLEPGWRRACIKPEIASLEDASCVVPTVRGRISVSLSGYAGNGECRMVVDIPANVTAEIYVPVPSASCKVLTAGSPTGLERLKNEPGYAVFSAGSGHFEFTVQSSR